MTDYDLIIVGGGISGLTAAYEVSKTNKRVALIEANDLGGMLQTTFQAGYQLEAAAHILTAKDSLKSLCLELELTLEFPKEETNLQAVFIEGRHVSFKKNPFSMARAGLLPFSEMLRALKNFIFPAKRFSEVEDMSVAECVRSFAGPTVAENLLKPILRGIYGGFSETQSAAWLLPSLWQRLSRAKETVKHSKKGASCRIKGGNFQLIRALASKIQSRDTVTIIKDSAKAVRAKDQGLNVILSSRSISATKVLWTADPEALVAEQDFSYVPITVSHFSCDRLPPSLERHLGVLFREDNCEPLLGIMCYSELFPSTAPHGKQLVSMMFGGTNALTWQKSDFMAFIDQVLSKHYKFENLEFLNSHPWPKAIPIYPVEYKKKLESLKRFEITNGGLFFINRQMSKPGVSDRIEKTLEALKTTL